MVDYEVMWMTRRIGRNTALSFPMWPLVLVGLFLVGEASNADLHLPSAVGWMVVVAPFLWLAHAYRTTRIHVTQHDQLTPGCRQCAAEADTLREREVREAARQAMVAETARLNRKYR